DDDEAPLPPNLHLQPAARDAADVSARLVLRHEPFPTTALHLVPSVEAVALEAEGRQHEATAGDRVLEGAPTITQRPRAEIASADLEHIEGNKDWRRRELVRAALAEQVELAHELGVEHAHFTVEDESRCGQLCDRGGQISEAPSVVNTLTGDEADS